MTQCLCNTFDRVRRFATGINETLHDDHLLRLN